MFWGNFVCCVHFLGKRFQTFTSSMFLADQKHTGYNWELIEQSVNVDQENK